MAKLDPGTHVSLTSTERQKLRFPPASAEGLVIAVHPAALKAPGNSLTLVAQTADDELSWVGAVDEAMLQTADGSSPSPRPVISVHLLTGPMLWSVIRPGLLTQPGAARPLYTVYDRDRPWVVVGQTTGGAPLAVPLNDARGKPKWWAPRLAENDLQFTGSKDSMVELGHLWSFEGDAPAVGKVGPPGRETLSDAIATYYG